MADPNVDLSGFQLGAAREAGYSDAEIAQELAKRAGVNYEDLVGRRTSDADIIADLMGRDVSTVQLGPTIAASERLVPELVDFDVSGAREAGYSVREIAQEIAGRAQVDYNDLRTQKEDLEIISELTGQPLIGGPAAFMQGALREAPPALAAGLGIAAVPFTGGASIPIMAAAGAGSYMVADEITKLFFPDKPPLERGFYEAGRTAGAGLAPVGQMQQAISKVPVAANLMMTNLVRDMSKKAGKPLPTFYSYAPSTTGLEKMFKSMQTMPAATSVIEGTSVASAALAGGLIEEAAPGNEFARLSAELSAGVLNPTLRIGQLAQLASRSVKDAITGISEKGRYAKFGPEIVTFLETIRENPEISIKNLMDENPAIVQLANEMGVDFGERLPAVAARSKGLGMLLQNVIGNERVGPTVRRSVAQNMNALSLMIEIMARSGDPNLMREAAKLEGASAQLLLEQRLMQVNEKAADLASKVLRTTDEDGNPVAVTAAQVDKASKIIADLNAGLMEEARAAERAAYALVDKAQSVPIDKTVAKYNTLMEEATPGFELPASVQTAIKALMGIEEAPGTDSLSKDFAKLREDLFKVSEKASNKNAVATNFAQKNPSAEQAVQERLDFDITEAIVELKAENLTFDNMIREIARVANDFREPARFEAVSSEYTAVQRQRAASYADKLIDYLQAENEVREIRYQQNVFNQRMAEDRAVPEGPKEVTLGELMSLRSNLLDMARGLSGGTTPSYKRAREIGELAEAVLDDIGTKAQGDLPENLANLKKAYAFSKSLNDVFTRAYPSTLLGKSATGEQRVPFELLADQLLRGGDSAVNLKYNELENAVNFLLKEGGADEGIAGTTTANLGTLAANYETILRDAARKTMNEDGTINTTLLRNYLDKNRRVLDKFPDLQSDLQDADIAKREMDRVTKEVAGEASAAEKAQSTIDQQRAYAAYLGRLTPREVITRAYASPEAAKDFEALTINALKGGEDVTKGFVSSVIDHAFVDAGGNNKTKDGNSMLDFGKLRKALYGNIATKQPSVISILRRKGAMSEEQAMNLRIILREAENIQNVMRQEKVPDVLSPDDVVGRQLSVLARIIGAREGSRISRMFGGAGTIQVPGIFANEADRIVSKIPKSRMADLMLLAATDKKVMNLLLEQEPKTVNKMRPYLKRLYTFAVGSGLVNAQDFAEDELDLTIRQSTYDPNRRRLGPTEAPSVQELQEYLSRSSAPAPAPAAPTAAQAPAAPAPTTVIPPSGAGPSPNTRASYSALFPGDVVSPLINQQQQRQGIMSLGPR